MSLAEQISNVTKGKVTLAQVQKIFKNDERRMQNYLNKVENRQVWAQKSNKPFSKVNFYQR